MDMGETYAVGDPRLEERPEATALRPRAVFVAHGMGQQVPFATLDDVARGLCETIDATRTKTTARTVRAGCTTLQRLEIELERDGQPLAPIHVFEAYWAPLTEGAVGLWQVVRFLLAAGFNGVRAGGSLHRFVYGETREFKVPRFHIAELVFVVALVVALVFTGTVVGTVGAAKLTFQEVGFVNEGLIAALSAIFELLLAVLLPSLVIALVLIAAAGAVQSEPDPNNPAVLKPARWNAVAHGLRLLTIPIALLLSLTIMIVAYVLIPLAFLFNEKMPFAVKNCGPCAWSVMGRIRAGAGAALRTIDQWARLCTIERWLWWMFVGVTLLLLAFALFHVVRRTAKSISDQERNAAGQWGGAVLALAAVAIVVLICGHSSAIALTTWIALLSIVLFVRRFLIQYVGDVAAYVSPHVVDRFFDLRSRIRTEVWKAARAVYALRGDDGAPLYGDVVIVGHSLGSVVVYDALNRLLNDDGLAAQGAPERCCDETPVEDLLVRERTRLLLTFGSPLDKTAFVFAMHDRGAGSERDALAASVQPLIAREDAMGPRFRWTNVWSPWDIIGGPVDFYHRPDGQGRRVENCIDPGATTPLAAHVEYWNNKLIYWLTLRALSESR